MAVTYKTITSMSFFILTFL